MKDEKRPLFTLADLMILTGAGMLLAGLYLFDWRLALVVGGLLLMLAGMARLRKMQPRL